MQNYVGKQIDRYRIIERLGMGGMAVVYKAYDTRLERYVALKLIRTGSIPPDQYDRLMKRFEREAKSQARFDHKHIVHIYDYGEVNGSPYLVMAYIPGRTLKDRLHGPVDWRQAVHWLIPVAEALSYAHQRGVIHRDVKPANVLFDDEDQPILTDFGIAKVLETDEATLTGTGMGVGTPEYMAPEQWQGKTSEATDQYALGVVLYEMITGRKPYFADTPAAVAIMQATEPLVPPSGLVKGIPESLEKVLYKALARDPQDRYEDMSDFALALRGLLAEAKTAEPVLPKKEKQKEKPAYAPRVTADSERVTRDALDATPVKEIDVTPKSKRRLPKWALWAGIGVICLVIVGLAIGIGMKLVNINKGVEDSLAAGAVEDTSEPPKEVYHSQEEAVVPASEITFWHQHSGDREAKLLKVVDDFNATNEYGITVTAEYIGGYGDIFYRMLPILNTPEVPDLVVGYQNQTATYQLADAMWDLNEIMDDPTWGMPQEDQDDFFPGFFAQDVFPSFDNARLGLPPNRSMEVLYYNMDWLSELGYDAPPTTPAEFKEMACAAVEQPFSGATAEGSMGYQLSIDASRFASWTFAFGGNVFDYENNQFTYNDPAAVEAWQFVQSLFADGCATIVTESYGDQTDFGAGRLLFTVGSSSGLPYYDSAVTEGANFNWSVAAIPHTTADPVLNVHGASVGIPKSTPERQLAAWLFLKYYTSPDPQAAWAKASMYFPTRASVADQMQDFFAEHPTYATAFDLLEYGIFEPPVPGYDLAREECETTMAAIIENSLTTNVTIVLDNLNEIVNKILANQMAQMTH